MIGALTGDIVGSVYEWNNIHTKDFPLFQKDCFFTDDSVMTIACAQAILDGGKEEDFIREYQDFGRRYPGRGYGGRFGQWLRSDQPRPYHSWGNGSAMRVSPCGWTCDLGALARTGVTTIDQLAARSAKVTHDHPEGIKGACAVTDAIVMSRLFRRGLRDDWSGQLIFRDVDELKQSIRRCMSEEYGYDMNRTLDEIRPTYQFNESCQQTVPEAVIAFLESTDFEDAIRNAISLGGDSDTLAAITGSIAEAAYGVPDWIREKTLSILDQPLREVVLAFENRCGRWPAEGEDAQIEC